MERGKDGERERESDDEKVDDDSGYEPPKIWRE